MNILHPTARSIASICLAALAVCSTIASARTPEPRVTRLSPEEKEALLDAGTEESAERAQAQMMGGGGDRRVHGEVGAMIGTGGARGLFGTAVIPLGENGTAVISYEDYRYGREHNR